MLPASFHRPKLTYPSTLQIDDLIVQQIIVVFRKLFLHPADVFDVNYKTFYVVGSHHGELPIQLIFEVDPVFQVELACVC